MQNREQNRYGPKNSNFNLIYSKPLHPVSSACFLDFGYFQLQNIKPSFSFPHGNIFITDTCLKSIAEVETAVTALFAFKTFCFTLFNKK